MRRLPLLTCTIVTVALCSSTTRADSQFGFHFGDATVTDGQASVGLFVRETVTGNSSSVLFADGGLGGTGFRLALGADGGARLNSIIFNPDFEVADFLDNTALLIDLDFDAGVGEFDESGGEALIATLTFDLGSSHTSFLVTDFDPHPSSSNTFTFFFTPVFEDLPFSRVLDENGNDADFDGVLRTMADATLTLPPGSVIIPLPSAAIAGGVMMAAMAATTLWRRARRRSI